MAMIVSLRAMAHIAAAVCLFTFGLASGKSHGKFDRSVLGNLKSQSGSMSIKVDRTHAFMATIGLGTPPQQLKCLVDSGSADLWVPSKRCRDCGSKHHFLADSSSSFSPVLYQTPEGPRPRAYQVTYGSGTITGFGVRDTFTFGPWSVSNQSFIIVEDQALPPGMPWDGIFGLGWSGIAKVGKPVYQRLQEAGHPALFALVPVRKGEAKLALGAVPEAEIKPKSLVWVESEDLALPGQPSDGKRTFWIVSGGVAVTRDAPTKEKFLIDTGTNQMLLVPTKYFSAFIRSLIPKDSFERHCGTDVGMGNLIVCDCAAGQSGDLPPLRLYLGERQFEIPIPELFTKVDVRDNGEPLCLLQVQPNDMGPQGLDSIMRGILPGILGSMPGILGPPPQGSSASSAGLPSFPGLVPVGGEQPSSSGTSSNGKHVGIPAFPFNIPGLAGMLKGMPKNMKPGESEEEIVQAQPNGDVCTTTVITEPDGTQRKSRKCGHGGPMPPRRLQGGIPILQAVPLQQGQEPGGGPMPILMQPGEVPVNPMQDLWVIGGVFMEKFVTIFDFDNKRVGFAEPLNPVLRLEQTSTSYQERSASQAFLPSESTQPPAFARAAATPAGGTAASSPRIAASSWEGQALPPPASPKEGPWQTPQGEAKQGLSTLGTMLVFLSVGGTVLCFGLCLVNAQLPWNLRRNAGPSSLQDSLPGE